MYTMKNLLSRSSRLLFLRYTMKHVFGINKRLNARLLAERRQEEEEEAAFQREQEMWEREDSRRFEREQRRARQDSGSAVPARRRSFIDVEKANALVEQATQIEKSAPKRGLILFQQALQLYIPAYVFRPPLLTKKADSIVSSQTEARQSRYSRE